MESQQTHLQLQANKEEDKNCYISKNLLVEFGRERQNDRTGLYVLYDGSLMLEHKNYHVPASHFEGEYRQTDFKKTERTTVLLLHEY
jgi:hypothetical protein